MIFATFEHSLAVLTLMTRDFRTLFS